MNLEIVKKEVFDYLNLFSSKLQEIQQNQATLAKNQELIARQNNEMIKSLKLILEGLEDEEDPPNEPQTEN